MSLLALLETMNRHTKPKPVPQPKQKPLKLGRNAEMMRRFINTSLGTTVPKLGTILTTREIQEASGFDFFKIRDGMEELRRLGLIHSSTVITHRGKERLWYFARISDIQLQQLAPKRPSPGQDGFGEVADQ